MSKLPDASGAGEGAERKECRKGKSPEDLGLGHAVKNRMTVIRKGGWGAIGLDKNWFCFYFTCQRTCVGRFFLSSYNNKKC